MSSVVKEPTRRRDTRDWLSEIPLPLIVALAWSSWALIATREWEVPQPGGLRFILLWLGSVAVGMGFLRWRLGRVGWLELLVVGAIAGAVLTDITQLPSQALRDWHLYLKAADRWTSGQPVYLQGPVTAIPADRTNYPFLYPPMTLPLFAAFAALPGPLADALWICLSIASVCLAFRLFGVPARWWLPLLSWAPVFQGLYVGNVAVPVALLFAAAPWWGAGLVVTGVFKLYSGLASLWLVRERRLRSLAAGIGIVVALGVLTLPLTGFDLWRQWLDGLGWYRESQLILPMSLYGVGLPRYVPEWIAYGIGAGAVVLALRTRGREGLAWFGLATVVASPSLFAHGFIVALPAFLLLSPLWAWTAIGITSIVPGSTFWYAVLIAGIGYALPVLRRRPARRNDAQTPTAEPMDLLAGADGPWPGAPDVAGPRPYAPIRRLDAGRLPD
jgi:hypothetical protein